MLRRVMPLLFLSIWSLTAFGFDQSHADWGEVLKRHVTDLGLVHYADLKAAVDAGKDDPFQRYTAAIQRVSKSEFDQWSVNERKAFLINAYNALTVRLIIEHFPVASIRDIGGFFTKPWDVEFFKLLDGAATSLDPIEHKLIRPVFRDFRVHTALNCASVSCPALRREPYVAGKLDEQLNDQMRRWLSDAARNRFDPGAKLMSLSKIFDWYQADFDAWGGGVNEVLSKFGPESARSTAKNGSKIEYLDYDWSLNTVK